MSNAEPNQIRDSLPPEIKSLVREFMNRPDTKAAMATALEVFRQFMVRRQEVGTIIALAEIQDHELRVRLAHSLARAVNQLPKAPAAPALSGA